MSFRADDARRYGAVPPVQYPVANQEHHPPAPHPERRNSYINGDDSAFFDPVARPQSSHIAAADRAPAYYHSNQPNHNGYHAAYTPSNYASAAPIVSPGGSTPATHNPQAFARNMSTSSRPYSTHGSMPSSPQGRATTSPSRPSVVTNFTPLPYNPAMYSSMPSGFNVGTGYHNPQPSTYSHQQAVIPAAYASPGVSVPAASASADWGYPVTPLTAIRTDSASFGPADSPLDNARSLYGYSEGNAPYPIHSEMPVGPNYYDDHYEDAYHTSRQGSQASLTSASPIRPTQLQRHPTNAPLPSRPMDEVLEEEEESNNDGEVEELMNDIEGRLGRTASGRARPLPITNGTLSDYQLDQLRRCSSSVAASIPSVANMHRLGSSASALSHNTAYSYGQSDVTPYGGGEYENGFVSEHAGAMADVMPGIHGFAGTVPGSGGPLPPLPAAPEEDDSINFDVGLCGGGYDPGMSYDPDVASPEAVTAEHVTTRTVGSPPRQPWNGMLGYAIPSAYETYEPFATAGLDYEGTGGLQEPSANPGDYDEDDVSIHSRHSGTGEIGEAGDGMQELFFAPGFSGMRPLPAIPTSTPEDGIARSSVDDTPAAATLPVDSRFMRATSMLNHRNTPHVHAPTRAQTDAAAERKRLREQTHTQGAVTDRAPPSVTDTVTLPYDDIILPRGRRKLNPAKLTRIDFNWCAEPWALSDLLSWIRRMAEGESDLKQKTVEECLVNLFSHKVPTMNIADAETLSHMVVESMLRQGILLREEEWVKWGPDVPMSGVLWQLTGLGCYSSRVHEPPDATGRCYSRHCMRTVKKLDTSLLGVSEKDWKKYWNIPTDQVQDWKSHDVLKQYALHEIITGEEDYIRQLNVLRTLYRDQLKQHQPSLIPPAKLDHFITTVFGKVDSVLECNQEHLLAQLKYRQREQGPWIVGFSDIFREWVRKAKTIYIEYCIAYPRALFYVKQEQARNIIFDRFLQEMQNDPRSERLDYSTYLKTPITRVQRYSLLMEAVLKHMIESSEEKTNLMMAMQEVRMVTNECDTRVAEMQKQVDMMELESNLVLRAGFHAVLNLNHLGRELIHQGDLQRLGNKGVTWVDAYALLLDHYFILAKRTESREGKIQMKYDVSKEPIPMPLLFLESAREEPISKQKGLPTPLTRTAVGAVSDTRINKLTNIGDRPSVEHSSTTTSISSLSRLNSSDPANILYPFKIKHLGHETYTLFAKDAKTRDLWCSKIVEAKSRHAKALHAQNAEPFSLRVIADTAFQYDAFTAMSRPTVVPVHGTPLDRALREMDQLYGPCKSAGSVCRSQVNCATGFVAFGRPLIAIGTDCGVYIADSTNPRGWMKTCTAARVTQIAILEEFSVCLLVTNRELTSYPLDVIAPVSGVGPSPELNDSPRRAPHRLAKDVSFFATAKMKDRMLVFYKRKEGMNSTFQVLEPVFQRSNQNRKGLFSRKCMFSGNTDTFRDFDKFYIPTECYSINLFQSYIAIATAKGFELLTLDKKQPMSIPDLKQPGISNIAGRVRDQKPLGMFKLNDQEFLLAYEDCAVYVDKHGDVSRTLIMEYSGKQKRVKAATMYGQYLVLFNEDYVEVRNAENGRLRQIVAGRDVRALDYGVRGPTGTTTCTTSSSSSVPNGRSSIGGTTGVMNTSGSILSNASGLSGATAVAESPGGTRTATANHQSGEWNDPTFSRGTVKIAMAHPEIAGQQIVLELVLNEGHTD